MSVDLIVYLRRTTMLTPKGWAAAARAAGFGLELPVDFDVETHTGYLPCRRDGAQTGFEYASGAMTDEERAEPDLAAFDFSVTFTTHSDMTELGTSVVAAAVLAREAGGALFDPQAGETVQPDQAIAWAHAQLAEIENWT